MYENGPTEEEYEMSFSDDIMEGAKKDGNFVHENVYDDTIKENFVEKSVKIYCEDLKMALNIMEDLMELHSIKAIKPEFQQKEDEVLLIIKTVETIHNNIITYLKDREFNYAVIDDNSSNDDNDEKDDNN